MALGNIAECLYGLCLVIPGKGELVFTSPARGVFNPDNSGIVVTRQGLLANHEFTAPNVLTGSYQDIATGQVR